MRRRKLRFAAGVAIVGLGVALAVVAATLGYAGNGARSISVATGAWIVVGALVVVLRPDNVMGWLFSAVGLLWLSGLTLAEYAASASGDVQQLVSWYAEWFWIAGLVTMISILYLFPTSRVPSPGWRWVLRMFLAVGGLIVVRAGLEGRVQASDGAPIVDNPIGIDGLGDVEDGTGGTVLALFLLVGALAAIASLVVRYRRSNVVEKQQLKWVALAGPVAVFGWFAAGALDSMDYRSDIFWVIPFAVIPTAAGIAILRHQLFDVDRLISRTLVYGLLTVLLGAAYIGLVLAGQAVFSSIAGGGDLAIAVSTLIVAALFLPVRSRVQAFVDRRFYRSRYDAQRTLEAFGARLRDQVELEPLGIELTHVVAQTMQPNQVSLWLREGSR